MIRSPSGPLPPSQSTHLLFGANRLDGAGSDVQQTLDFISSKLGDIIQGRTLELSYPPTISLLCNHLSEVSFEHEALPRKGVLTTETADY